MNRPTLQHYDRPENTILQWPAPAAAPGTDRKAYVYRAAHPLSDVAVPALIALISAIAIAVFFGWLWWEWDWLPDWVPFLAFVATFLAVWYVLGIKAHEGHLMIGEDTTKVEALQATNFQPIQASYFTVELARHVPGRKNPLVEIFDVPCAPDKFIDVANAMIAGDNLAESRWAGLSRGLPFSATSLTKFKNTIVGHKLAEWIDTSRPKLGIKVMPAGREWAELWRDQYYAMQEAGEVEETAS